MNGQCTCGVLCMCTFTLSCLCVYACLDLCAWSVVQVCSWDVSDALFIEWKFLVIYFCLPLKVPLAYGVCVCIPSTLSVPKSFAADI